MKDKEHYIRLISEVEKEISDKEGLINKKYIHIKLGKKGRYKSITKPYVEAFAKQEIERLNKKKEALQKEMEMLSQYSEVYISWDWVSFENGRIIITFPNKPINHYKLEVPKAKACFNYIHKRIEIALPPFKVKYWTNIEEIALIDTPSFNSIIRYLEIKSMLKNMLEKKAEADFHSFKEYLPNKLDEFYYPPKKSVYMNFLCINQCSNYKIIPLEEVKISNDVLVHENSFLFTLIKDNKLVIIWENINEARASYVFSTSEESYEHQISIIFQYVVSPMSRKRLLLHNSKKAQSQLGAFHIVNHTDYNIWKQKLYTQI